MLVYPRFARTLLTALLLALGNELSHAEKPSVTFDFANTAECRELTSGELIEAYPGEKIVELKLRVSVHLDAGQIEDLEEVRIEAGDCDRRMRVHSFEPSTQLESLLSDDILWSKTVETGNSLGASLGGEAPVLLGDVVAHVTPTINGGKTSREIVTETQKRVAPKHVVVTSGTIDQGHGVFFKLRRSPQTSLEGVHELTIRFIVSESWRGDSIRVCCQALGQEEFLWLQQQATWAHKCAPVAVYLAGDLEARRAAISFSRRRTAGL
ncbi:MAG: hypothetical protein KDA57_00715 [Planctomycetales bacterium]|nr:hypothetical protein [Planctomycetales bacterium]